MIIIRLIGIGFLLGIGIYIGFLFVRGILLMLKR